MSELDRSGSTPPDRSGERPLCSRALRAGFIQPAPAGSLVLDDRLVYLGDNPNWRPLEVVAVEMDPEREGQHLRVIHAMELRDKYRSQYEEARKWRL